MEAAYLAKGWTVTARPAEADLLVVRGCSVTARAQRDCERRIDHLRRHYPKTPLRLCGCLPKATKAPSPAADRHGSPSTSRNESPITKQ